jgi:hypothetical protein
MFVRNVLRAIELKANLGIQQVFECLVSWKNCVVCIWRTQFDRDWWNTNKDNLKHYIKPLKVADDREFPSILGDLFNYCVKIPTFTFLIFPLVMPAYVLIVQTKTFVLFIYRIAFDLTKDQIEESLWKTKEQ